MGKKEHLRVTDKVKYIFCFSVRTKVGRFGGIYLTFGVGLGSGLYIHFQSCFNN